MTELTILILADMVDFFKDILSHPNGPAYIQAAIVALGLLAGTRYLKKKDDNRKLDLYINTFKNCIKASDSLSSVLNLKEELNFTSYSNSEESNANFVKLIRLVAKYRLQKLNSKFSVFNDLNECRSEIELDKSEDKIEDIKELVDLGDEVKDALNDIISKSETYLEYTPSEDESILVKTLVINMSFNDIVKNTAKLFKKDNLPEYQQNLLPDDFMDFETRRFNAIKNAKGTCRTFYRDLL